MDIRKRQTTYRLGTNARLEVLRVVSIGAYLDGGTTDILLPLKYCPAGLQEADVVDVFVYHDNEGRLIATTLKSTIAVGQIRPLRAVSVTTHGAFMDWGIQRDLFIPYAEQKDPIDEGRTYLVYAYIDELSGKVVGTTKLAKHLGNIPPTYAPGSAVEAYVYGRTDAGWRLVVDGLHWGMIYADESEEVKLRYADLVTAYVIRIRDDGRIDLSLKPVGYARIEPEADHLLDLLHRTAGCRLPVGDRSTPKEVRDLTGMTKRTFKMAVSKLYKQRLISVEPTAIALKESPGD